MEEGKSGEKWSSVKITPHPNSVFYNPAIVVIILWFLLFFLMLDIMANWIFQGTICSTRHFLISIVFSAIVIVKAIWLLKEDNAVAEWDKISN